MQTLNGVDVGKPHHVYNDWEQAERRKKALQGM